MAVRKVTGMYHPWRELRDQKHITVLWEPLPDHIRGCTNGTDTIWMDTRLLQVERRCTIAHEQTHIRLGHTECQDEKTETKVRRLTALQLIDTADLIEACKWSATADEVADELWVTVDVLMDRIQGLAPVERAFIDHAIREAWHHD